jgi:CheY-like chemotaxis protein
MVDDDALLRDTVASILSHLGYTPVLAATGEEALARLAEPPEPVLVILDLDMPGMGGAWALAMIRNQRPDLPVVIASGHHSRVTAELAELFPRVSLMPKPYGLQDIRKLLA